MKKPKAMIELAAFTLPKMRPTPGLNVITFRPELFPDSKKFVEQMASLKMFGAIKLSFSGDLTQEFTLLVPGDFMDLFLSLKEVGCGDHSGFKIYSLSAHHADAVGLQHPIRMLCRRHLRDELKLLGLEIPESLQEEDKFL
jgi:hypothetical protein